MIYIPDQSPYRYFIKGLTTKVPLHNESFATAINFDNSATTPPFISVMDSIMSFSSWYSSIHRGTGYKSQLSSEIYEDSRKIVADFVGADLEKDAIIYVKNATEAINKLSYRLTDDKEDCVILSTWMEHHSNDLPWRFKYKTDYVEVDEYGRLLIDDLEKKLKQYNGKVKLVTVTGASNVTGYINPIYKIASLAHKYGAKILVDGAQFVPHCPMDMKPHYSKEHIDYLAFSAHKMYAPFGTGVLIGPKSTFQKGIPDYCGGGTINSVSRDLVLWANPPEKDEAGTPNVMGVQALVTAIKTINELGMKNIENYETYLLKYTTQEMEKIPGIKLYAHKMNINTPRVAIIPFNIEGIHHSTTAKILSGEKAIAVRNGCFCAQPYLQRLLNLSKDRIKDYSKEPMNKRPGVVRLSFGMYNNYKEIQILLSLLKNIVKNKEYYIKKYS